MIFKSIEDYSRCKVCGSKLPAPIRAFAVRKLQPSCCGHACYRRDIIKRFACCEDAEVMECVCMYAFKCKTHGTMHIGTHD